MGKMKSKKSCDGQHQVCYTWEINDSSEVGRYTPILFLVADSIRYIVMCVALANVSNYKL
jgi:hypothetical protein